MINKVLKIWLCHQLTEEKAFRNFSSDELKYWIEMYAVNLFNLLGWPLT